MAVIKLPRVKGGEAVLDGDTWNQRIAPAIERNMLDAVAGPGDLINSASGQTLRIRPVTQGTQVMFQRATSVVSFYLGYIYYGTPTGPFPQGLTQGQQVYIQNLNEWLLPNSWPTGNGEPGIGFPTGSFTDPATQLTLPLITVDHPARGRC